MIIFPGGEIPIYGDTLLSIEGLLVGLSIDGVTWVFEEIEGWRHGGGVETNFASRPSQHGNFDGPVYRRSRVIGVKGVCLAGSRELAEEASEQVAAVLADGSVGTFATQSPRGYRSAQVKLSDVPLSSWINPVSFRWSLQFTAPDWRKYGEPQEANTGLPGGGTGLSYPLSYPLDYGDPGESGRISFTNNGTASTEPVFEVAPSLAQGFEITRVETAQRLRYEHPVTSTLTVDCAAGTVTEAGQRRARYLTVREWFSVAPGETATFQFSTLGSETHAAPARLSGLMSPAYP